MPWIDLFFIPLVLYAGHQIINRVVRVHNLHHDRRLLVILFYYHLLFAIIFGLYVTVYGGDAVGYWKAPGKLMPLGSNWLDLHVPGTSFIYFLTYPFSQVLGISFWGGTLLFSLFGFGGMGYLYLSFRQVLQVNPRVLGIKIFPLVLFLPNMHFWTGGIGKDSIAFFALMLFVHSLIAPQKNIPGILISFYLAYFVRPHMALLMSVGLAFGLLLSTKGTSFFWRMTFLALSVYVFFLIAPAVFEFIGLEEEGLENFEDVANIRSKNLSRANVGSAIDIRNYSVPLKLFTFLFRPLFFDAGNVFGIIVSFENIFYLILAVMIIRVNTPIELLRMPQQLKAALIVFGSTAFFMSNSLSNLGIIIRQKNMVMMMFLLIAGYLISQRQARQIRAAPPAKPKLRLNDQPSVA